MGPSWEGLEPHSPCVKGASRGWKSGIPKRNHSRPRLRRKYPGQSSLEQIKPSKRCFKAPTAAKKLLEETEIVHHLLFLCWLQNGIIQDWAQRLRLEMTSSPLSIQHIINSTSSKRAKQINPAVNRTWPQRDPGIITEPTEMDGNIPACGHPSYALETQPEIYQPLESQCVSSKSESRAV